MRQLQTATRAVCVARHTEHTRHATRVTCVHDTRETRYTEHETSAAQDTRKSQDARHESRAECDTRYSRDTPHKPCAVRDTWKSRDTRHELRAASVTRYLRGTEHEIIYAAVVIRAICGMRYNLLLMLLLLPLLQACGAEELTGDCAVLRDLWGRKLYARTNKNIDIKSRTVQADGEHYPLQVWDGAGGSAHAAAAAQLAVLHVMLGYDVRLRQGRADLCELARSDAGPGGLAVVAAVATWPPEGCRLAHPWALDELTSLGAGPAAAPAHPLLLAHAPRCAARAARWDFYLNFTSEARDCGFSDASFEVLARNNSEYDALVLQELERRTRTLPVTLRCFPTDRDLRTNMSRLRDRQIAFLFVDEDVWVGEESVVRVQPPPCAPGAAGAACSPALLAHTAVRVGDGAFLRTRAPGVARFVAGMTFAPADLRAILAYEENQTTPDIEQVGCRWAHERIDTLFDLFHVTGNVTRAKYYVAVFPCADDPDASAYAAVAAAVNDHLEEAARLKADVRYRFESVDCSREDALPAAVENASWPRDTVGLVAWSAAAGVSAAAAAASRARLPLLLVGAAPPAGPARAASGRLADLTSVYLRLLELCEWSRFAVISDRSAYSTSFADALLDRRAGDRLLHRDYAPDALEQLQRDDARVVVLNARYAVARAVVCDAAWLGSAPPVWLAREWDATRCASGVPARVYSLSPSWRGGDAADGAARLRARLQPDNGTLAPPLAGALADVLLQISVGFDTFLREHPTNTYDLRGSPRTLEKYLDRINETGVAGILQNDNSALKEPLVYLEAWEDERGRVAAAWRVRGADVRQLRPEARACAAVLGAPPPADRAACHTARTGDRFAPRCQDVPVFASAVFLALAALALLLARRARLAYLRRCAEALRERAASRLEAYLVDRGDVTLLHEIGSGCYGRVHFAELRRPDGATQAVAAKEPRAGAEPAEEGELLREACVLAPLAHAHVVRLVGVCVRGPPLVLMEHALHLDLQRYLAERRGAAGRCGATTPRALTRLAREAAAALQYLAGRRLVHRDVRAANCLVDERRALKLADFGMARELDAREPEYATTRRGLFPVLWMAPESLERGVFSPASDVWALGVLALEVATLGARPFGCWAPAQVLRWVAAGGHAPLPPDLGEAARELLLACWAREPERRPSAAAVCAALAARPDAVRAALQPPLLPDPPPLAL